ncbi:prephenate dehydrogenase/arogenate dehydrogenase family protein [Consotaella aegiceratis]|uniref:prephenate dehydrogenase/arogenate dehydrogenase family protein n=1 Tax=Consotaella aegiceratis TaxID=3097961 RepID=UPI002F42DE22
MASSSRQAQKPTLGFVGFGAFARLAAGHLHEHFSLCAHDPAFDGVAVDPSGVVFTDLATVARCPVVVLAVPVGRFAEAAEAIAPHIEAGTLVLDVGSVKVGPARVMLELLPDHVDIVATHPLFGPQSARAGIAGLKIAVCPLRGSAGGRVAAFLRRFLRLDVIVTTPERHDRDAAMAQGLTHLIAKVLVQMEPLPTRVTTRSFDLLVQAVEMVRHDAPEVFDAIERLNPYAEDVRRRFFALASDLALALDDRPNQPRGLIEVADPSEGRPGGELSHGFAVS